MRDPNTPDVHAIITGSPTELEKIAQTHSVNLERVVVGDNGIVGYYESGPAILKQVAEHLNLQEHSWDLLSQQDQTALVSLTAGNLEWVINSKIDPYYIDQLLDYDTGLRERIRSTGAQNSITAQYVSAIISAPKAILEEITQTHQMRLQYIEESQNRAHGHYDDGPLALAQLQEYLEVDPALAPGWEDLTPQEQQIIVTRLLVDNPSWIDDGTIGEGAVDDFITDQDITSWIAGTLPPSKTPQKR